MIPIMAALEGSGFWSNGTKRFRFWAQASGFRREMTLLPAGLVEPSMSLIRLSS